MKRLILFILLCITCTFTYAQDTLRIMTFNVYSIAMTSLEELACYIKQYDPDIVALQEVDYQVQRPEAPAQHNKNQMLELGFYTNMFPVFSSINAHPTGGYYGMGILSKSPIQSVLTIPLPQIVDQKEPRAMMLVQWCLNEKTITLCNTHLSLDIRNRRVQMRHIRKLINKYTGIKIVCGDLNSTPEEGLVHHFFNGWRDALPKGENTFSSWNPIYKYDWILIKNSPSIRIIDSRVDYSAHLSDHIPGIIDIILK